MIKDHAPHIGYSITQEPINFLWKVWLAFWSISILLPSSVNSLIESVLFEIRDFEKVVLVMFKIKSYRYEL